MQYLKTVLVCGLFAMLSACQPPEESASTVQTDAPASEDVMMSNSCNLAVTAAQSDVVVREQLQCLQGLGEAAGGQWAQFAAAIVEVSSAINTWNGFVLTFNEEEVESPTTSETDEGGLTLTGETRLSIFEVIDRLASATEGVDSIRPRALGRCLESTRTFASELKPIRDAIAGLSEGSTYTLATVTNLIGAVGGSTQSAFQLADALLVCLPGNNAQAIASFRRSAATFSSGLGRLTAVASQVIAIARCGHSITRGVIALSHNTQCLMADLAHIRAQNEQITRTANATVPSHPWTDDRQADCDALLVRQVIRYGQSTGARFNRNWTNSGIRSDCTQACSDGLFDFVNAGGGECRFTTAQTDSFQTTCSNRCYMAAGGT